MNYLKPFSLIFFVVYSYSLYTQNEQKKGELELFGRISLIDEITENGDTIFNKNTHEVVQIITVQEVNGKVISKTKASFSIHDSVYHYLPQNTTHKIYIKCKGYYMKGFEVDTYGVPKTTKGYEVGFIFPYTINLLKKKSFKANNKIVASIYYDKLKEYFEFKLP